MKAVAIGGTGLIGSKLVANLRLLGHEVLAASPNTGVDTLTGKGFRQVLKGAQVVVDVSNSPCIWSPSLSTQAAVGARSEAESLKELVTEGRRRRPRKPPLPRPFSSTASGTSPSRLGRNVVIRHLHAEAKSIDERTMA